MAQGAYVTRDALASLVGLGSRKGLHTEAVEELVAIGAAIASNCEPCFRFHYDKARKLGVSKEDMARAVLELAEKYLGEKVETVEAP